MKVVTYNIQFGLGKEGRNDLERIADTVGEADIIALQEVERNWQHSGHVDQPEILSRFLAGYYWVYGPYFDVDASRKNADGTIVNARRQFGNMILSKTPILSTRLFPLPKSTIVDQHNMVMGMFEGVVELGSGQALRIYNAHLSAKSENDRLMQIELICDTIARAPSEGGAWVGSGQGPIWGEDQIAPPMPDEFLMLGDFNHTPNGREYDQLVRPRENGSSLFDCWTLTGHDRGEGVTFIPATDPENGERVDFAFVDHTMKNRVKTTWIDDKAQGSDHQPYWIEIDGEKSD